MRVWRPAIFIPHPSPCILRAMDRADRPHWHNVPDARQLRKQMTPTESQLWRALRNRRLRGYKFRRQHPVANFVLDFYSAEHRLAIEIDGAVHGNPEQRMRDQSREDLLRERGIRFLRIPAWRVERDLPGVLEEIAAALKPSP